MRPVLRLLCHLAVALWIGAYLGWTAARPGPAVPAPEALAELEPLPPPEAPASSGSRDPAPVQVGEAEIAAGESLLAGDGAFPALSLSYERFPSFAAYAESMQELGARFVVVQARRIVGGVEPATGALVEAGVDARFSPRARDYTAEPALAAAARAARERLGPGAEVMMLVPRRVDAGLFGGLARALAERGEGHAAYREILGRYERSPGGGVRLRVEAAEAHDGRRLPLDLVFDLSDIARRGDA